MKKLLVVFLLLGEILCSCAQSPADSTTLINEAGNKLKSGTAVSTILTDKKYLSVHPSTAFRELIKENCNTTILKITTSDEPGKKIKVSGSVTGKDGKAVSNALVYLYQTDAKGWYAANAPHILQNEGDMRHARLFGYVKTDAQGKFELHTVKPSGYPKSDLPAHIHVHVWADNFAPFVTEFLFDDDTRLVGKIREDAINNRFMIAKPATTIAPFEQQFSYTIVLEKSK